MKYENQLGLMGLLYMCVIHVYSNNTFLEMEIWQTVDNPIYR